MTDWAGLESTDSAMSLMLTLKLTIAMCLGLIPAKIAQKKGRNFLHWWIYGSLLFIIAIIHSLMLQPDTKAKIRAALDPPNTEW